MMPDDNSSSALIPLCDGQRLARRNNSPHAPARRAFVEAYHRINLLSRKLASVRSAPPGAARNAAERAVLEEIEKALLARDAVEDRYAAVGVAASPVFERGVVTNIVFSVPAPRRARRALTVLSFAVTPDGPAPIETEM